MSHVETISIEIRDLDALAQACNELGCELMIGRREYKWFGVSVGDYPIPEGFTAEDLGRCDHAIRVRNANEQTYEVGVVARRDGKPGFTLQYDFWEGGYGLEAKVGQKCGKLVQGYATQVAIKQARKQGFSVQQKRLPNGKVQLVCSRG